MKKCPFCTDGLLERKTIIETYQYKGHTLEIAQAGEYCNHCDEGILSGKDLQETQKEIRDFQANIERLLTIE